MNISEFVTHLLELHNMTDAQLAELLGYKSKTSIVRVRNQDIGIHSMETFVERLRSHFQLTAEENAILDDALSSLYWQDDFESIRSMKRLLSGEKIPETDPIVELLSDSSSAEPFLQRYGDKQQIHIALFNCHHVSIYSSLQQLLAKDVRRIDHFLLPLENTADIINVFHRIIHLIHHPAYAPYTIARSIPTSHRGVLTTDFMVISYQDDSGTPHQDLILFDQPDHGLIITGTPKDNFAALLPIPQEMRMPIKRDFPDYSALEDYVQFCNEFADLEHNRVIYKLRPDISFDWIPTEILLSAIQKSDLPAADNFSNAFQQLIQISRKRTKNIFEKKQPSYSILKQSALWNFANTGKTTDHFWAMRAFTPRERMNILSDLLHQMRNNPNFHIYFLKDEHVLLNDEVILYEGEGVLMTNSRTSYDLAGGHVEMMVVVPKFCRLFRDYFTQVLLKDNVLPQDETCALLEKMIQHCKEMIENYPPERFW